MASRAVQAIIEENPFAIDLFNFLFGALNHAKGQIPNRLQSYFNEDIGYAVLYMQFVTRDCLRDVLKLIHIRTTEDALHVTRKLCRARRKKNPDQVFQLFLECCAIITEVYLYCSCGIHLPVETCMVFLSWNFVFNRRRIREFLSNGGWDELSDYAVQKFRKKINFISFQMDLLEYPYENFITSQTYDHETEVVVADFKESFACFTANREFQVDQREQYRQYKAALRMKRVETKLIATKRIGTAEAESILASQSTLAMRSGRRPTTEPVSWTNDISPYVSSEEEEYEVEDPSPTVSELCTKMSEAQIASFAELKKKKQKRKKKPSQKQTETEQPQMVPSKESESPEDDTIPQTFASSSRPLQVPVRSPATSPTKTDKSADTSATKEASSGQSKAGKKGKKKK